MRDALGWMMGAPVAPEWFTAVFEPDEAVFRYDQHVSQVARDAQQAALPMMES